MKKLYITTTLIWYFIFAATLVLSSDILTFFKPEQLSNVYSIREYHLVEFIQVLVLFIVSVMAFSYARENKNLPMNLCILFFAVFVLLEETSYGYHYFYHDVDASILNNRQSEPNLHNSTEIYIKAVFDVMHLMSYIVLFALGVFALFQRKVPILNWLPARYFILFPISYCLFKFIKANDIHGYLIELFNIQQEYKMPIAEMKDLLFYMILMVLVVDLNRFPIVKNIYDNLGLSKGLKKFKS